MPEKVLVINDDSDILKAVEIILKSKGYLTECANNGKAGIESAIQNKPDLILLDIMMPDMNGYETCQALKAQQGTKDVPVIFLSSLTSPKDKVKGLECGAVDFINSVVDHGELLARVQTHLRIKFLNQELMKTNEELTKKQKYLDDDLKAAAGIQRSFLPSSNLKISNIEFASSWLPAHQLGGDIFNLMHINNNKVVFYIVDVSGHDVPSALVTISISQFLEKENDNITSTTQTPSAILQKLNQAYPMERFDRYFTIFYLILDTLTGEMTYSSAGHPSAIVITKDGKTKLLNSGGTIIGLNSEFSLDEGEITLSFGDKVILYTDGIIERKNGKGEFYGVERLCHLLEKVYKDSIKNIVNAIQLANDQFAEAVASEDDMSVIGFELLNRKEK